jgi:hypothetical protein
MTERLRLLTWLEDFIAQFCYHIGHKICISIGKEWHRCYKGAAVVVYNILYNRIVVMRIYKTNIKKHSLFTGFILRLEGLKLIRNTKITI